MFECLKWRRAHKKDLVFVFNENRSMKKVILIAASLMLCAVFFFFFDANVGSMVVALRERPDDLSDCVRLLKFGEKVAVAETVRSVMPFDGDRKKFPTSLVSTWIKVRVEGDEGYVPQRSLVKSLGQEDERLAGEIGRTAAQTAKHNFSETEDEVALVSMKGAAGDARLCGSMVKEDDVLAVIAESKRGPMDDSKIREFLDEGGLHGMVVPTSVAKGEGGLSAADAFAKVELLSKKAEEAGKLDDEMKQILKMAKSLAVMLAIDEIDPKFEFGLGLRVLSRVFAEYKPVPPSDERSAYVNRVGQSVAKASVSMPFAGYRFVLVESADANAFAVPGGIVCVCTGLLDFLKNEDELAAVLGHEIAHVEMRHGLKSLDQNAMLTICSDVLGLVVEKDRDLSSPKVKEAIKLVVDEMFNRIRNGYSADLEGQADWRAIQFLARVGYDVKSLQAVLDRFKEKFGTYGGAKYPERRGQDVDTYRRQLGLAERVAEGQRVREMRYKMTLGF